MIGIGAGPATDGQVLVFHDLLGIYDGHAARFVKRYADVRGQMVKGVSAFAADVRERRYPEPDHGYTMAPDEVERLRDLLASRPASRSPAAQPLRSAPDSCASRRRATATWWTSPPAWRAWSRRPAWTTAWCPCSCPAPPRRSRRWSTSPAACTTCARRSSGSVPAEGDYEHNRLNADTNSHAHIQRGDRGPVGDRAASRRAARSRHLAAARARGFRRSPAATHRAGPRPGLNRPVFQAFSG